MTAQFNGNNALEYLRVLAQEIGPRLSATAGEERATQYIEKTLSSFGLKTQVQEFTAPHDSMLEFNVEVLDPPSYGRVKSNPWLGSSNTPPEGLEGEIHFVEKSDLPYVGGEISGKIVVLPSMGLPSRAALEIVKYAPLAVVFVGASLSQQPHSFHLLMRKPEMNPPDRPPAFFITYSEAVHWKQAGVKRLRIVLRSETRPGKSHNVIAELPGNCQPDEIIVIGAHMDSVPEVPGASDNAAGVATMLELARVFAQKGSRRTLRFAAWGSEEGGGLGSSFYLIDLKKKTLQQKQDPAFIPEKQKTELEKILFNVNLDVLGLSVGHNVCHALGPEALQHYIRTLSIESGIPAEVTTDEYSSDNMTFAWMGIPSLSFTREGPGWDYMHSALDALDVVDATSLQRMGSLAEIYLERCAGNAVFWPFKREVPAEVQEDVRKFSIRVLERLGEDPALLN